MTTQQFHIEQIHRINDIKKVADFRQVVSNYHAWLVDSFKPAPVTKLVLGRAFFVDCLVRHFWKLLSLNEVKDLGLVAVGGYGRGHLNLQSDIDLLILSKSSIKDDAKEKISQFVTLMWDVGLDIGQSVRTIKETVQLGKNDITIATNLIESRLLAGNDANYQKLKSELAHRRFWPSDKFFTAKLDEQQTRHNKFNGTSYNLEPNLKENPGCLRDIQMIGWVAKKHFKVSEGDQLVREEFLQPEELLELQDCRKFLWRMRFALHIVAGRSENRMLFEYQPQVAELLGYGEGKASVEKMMKEFFIIIRRVIELNQMLLQYFDEEIIGSFNKRRSSEINESYDLYNGLIRVKHAGVIDSPEELLNLFELIANHDEVTGLHSLTLREVRTARRLYELGSPLSEIPECRVQFLRLLRHPKFFATSWDLMHKHGVMAVYSFDWRHIVGLMQFDLFHAYTVDEHTHRLVKYIHRYTLPEYKKEFPRCSRICNEHPKIELLYLAAIFHDICKGRGGDHSELGAVAVREFMSLHGYTEPETKLVAWLVENHLLMSVVAQRRDIHDPEVIAEFCGVVKDESYLNFLYALTLADMRATNKNLWNQWKSSLLRELYILTQKAFRSGYETKVDQADRITARKRDAKTILQQSGTQMVMVETFWSDLDDDYFLRYKPEQLAWHCQVVLAPSQSLPLIAISNEHHRGGTAVFVYCKDKHFLFAAISSALDKKGFNVHDALIMSNEKGFAVDTFIILENDGGMVAQNRYNDIRSAVINAIADKVDLEATARVPRQIKQFNVPTKVSYLASHDTNKTLLELEALDTPGLLAKIGQVFFENQITIHTAKVTTIGERAEDFFIVTNAEGEALTLEQKQSLTKQIKQQLSLSNLVG